MSVPPPLLHTVNPAVSPRTSEVIGKALAKNPDERFASYKEFARKLAESFGADAEAAVTMHGAAMPRAGDGPSGCRGLLAVKFPQVLSRGSQQFRILGIPDRFVGGSFGKVGQVGDQLAETHRRGAFTEFLQKIQQIPSHWLRHGRKPPNGRMAASSLQIADDLYRDWEEFRNARCACHTVIDQQGPVRAAINPERGHASRRRSVSRNLPSQFHRIRTGGAAWRQVQCTWIDIKIFRMAHYITTIGWYRFGRTASPMATNSPCRVTALTYREAGCERKGDAGKLRPLRIWVAVRSSTNTLGNPGSIWVAGTRASSSRSSAARDSNCAMVRAWPISNSPLDSLRNSWRCAPQPNDWPRSYAIDRM